MIDQGAKEDTILGIAPAGDVDDYPKQSWARFVAFIWVTLSQDWERGVKTL